MLKHFFLLLVSIITLASCGDDDPTPSPVIPTTAQNTVFVFMPYTANDSGNNSLYPFLLTNINDMERAIVENNGLGDTHLIIFISNGPNKSNLINISYNKGKCVRDTVKTYDTATYTSAEGITALLGDAKKYAPAKNYSMIVGCHGEGWLPAAKKTTRFFGGMKYQINITDLAQGIKKAGMSMNYIMFDDCYMSTVEVAYDLREVTNYLIASTSEMMDYGMPYHKTMKYLISSTPDYEALCDEFITFYNAYERPYGTIAVTRTAKIEEMAVLMKNINDNFTFNENDIDKVQDLDAMHYNPTVYFDFGSYVHTMCKDDDATLDSFNKLLNELVPYKASTQYIYSYMGGCIEEVKEFSGLTISDPSTNSVAVETKKQTAWWKATH